MEERINKVLSYEKTKSEWRGNHLSIEWQEANKLNIELFGISLNKAQKCECIEDLFFALKRPNIVNKIKENPTLIKFFDKVPENWEKIVGIVEDVKEVIEDVKEVIKIVRKTRAKRK